LNRYQFLCDDHLSCSFALGEGPCDGSSIDTVVVILVLSHILRASFFEAQRDVLSGELCPSEAILTLFRHRLGG